MKRLIPAAIILICVITVCFASHCYVWRICDITVNYVEDYKNEKINSRQLIDYWHKNKQNLEITVNHKLLDDISIYIDELTVKDLSDDDYATTFQNIKTSLQLIKNEYKLAKNNFF